MLLAALLLAPPALPAAAAEVAVSTPGPVVDIVWPLEGAKNPYVERSFTFGQVIPGSTLAVNGATVAVDGDGVFFDMVRFSSGSFALAYRAEWMGQTVSTTRLVEVGPPHGLPELGKEGLAALYPAVDLELRSGDLVVVACRGVPGAPAVFQIRGLTSKLPMAESSGPVRGIYEGHYWVQPGDRGKELKTVCGIKTGMFGGPSAEAPGKITILDPSQTRTAVTAQREVILKTLEGGYTLFFPQGVRLEITGRQGPLLRARLSEHESGWVDASRVELLPEGTPPPRGKIGQYLNTEPGPRSTRLVFDASERLPFELRQTVDPLRFELRFFGADQRFDRIHYATDDPIIKEVRWRQESSRVVSVVVETRLAWGWGYRGGYDEKGKFVLEIRRPPYVAESENVLAGRRVVLDAGHGPSESAVGPRRTTERDINLALAERLEDMLTKEGAEVYMIRRGTDGPALTDRTVLAEREQGDVYVSIHNNAFPVTADPLARPRGFMHFYYHPQSRPLVEAVHAAYLRGHPDLADEFARWGDLHVCRMTEMPSILTESAYVILPEHEKKLLDPVYQKRLARSMLDGLRGYYEAYRALQSQSPAEKRAAR